MKTGPTNKEDTKERIIATLKSKGALARSSLAIFSKTAFYTLPALCKELEAEGKVEITPTPSATYYKLSPEFYMDAIAEQGQKEMEHEQYKKDYDAMATKAQEEINK